MFRVFSLCLFALLGSSSAFAGMIDLAKPSTVRSQIVKFYCAGVSQPYVLVNLYVNNPDQGRPGLVYAGMHDPAQSRGILFTAGGGAVEYGGEAMYAPYSIESAGLHDAALTLPVGPADWTLYVGYGALSAKDEATVQSGQDALARVRAMGKPAPNLDPNQHRRSFIQHDFEQSGKYSLVMKWTQAQVHACDPVQY